MEPRKAVYDPATIKAWDQQLQRHRKGIGRIRVILLSAFVIVVASVIGYKVGVLAGVAIAFGLALTLTQMANKASLRCPHCGCSPTHRSPEYADYCNHCYYWLKSPYASDAHGR